MGSIPPPDESVITDVERLHAISDPLRIRIMTSISARPRHGWTVKEIASRLGESQTKLYRHIALLEERGFLRIASTRLVSGITERRYQVAAKQFRVDRSLFGGFTGEAKLLEAYDAMAEDTRRELMGSHEAGLLAVEQGGAPVPLVLSRSVVRVRPERAVELVARLREILDEEDVDEREPGVVTYGVFAVWYPVPPTRRRSARKRSP